MADAARIERLEDVPEDVLDKVMAGFAGEGALVTKQRQSNGKWTVIADFSRSPAADS